MFGLFDLFGRSTSLKALDQALRAAGLHPLLVPEAVKLTVLQLEKKQSQTTGREAAYENAAQLLAYCMLGRDQFIESNDLAAGDRAEDRLEAAIAEGDSLDAKLVLLAVHAGLIAPEMADRVDVEGE